MNVKKEQKRKKDVQLIQSSHGLGLTWRTTSRVDTEKSSIYVHKVTVRRPAAQSGKIQVGDILLFIDGVSVEGTSLSTIQRSLRDVDTGTPVTLTFSTNNSANSIPSHSEANPTTTVLTSDSDAAHAIHLSKIKNEENLKMKKKKEMEMKLQQEKQKEHDRLVQRRHEEQEQHMQEAQEAQEVKNRAKVAQQQKLERRQLAIEKAQKNAELESEKKHLEEEKVNKEKLMKEEKAKKELLQLLQMKEMEEMKEKKRIEEEKEKIEQLRLEQEEKERQAKQQRDTVASIQRGTFSPDFDDDDGFDEDFASMLGGSQLGRTNPSTPNIGSADQSGISTYEMEDESKDEFEFDTDF